MDYTPEQLNGLIAEVEKEFKVHLSKAEESFNLAKSEDEAESNKSKDKDKKKAQEESEGESDKDIESEDPKDKGIKDQDQPDEDEAGKSDQNEPGENLDEDAHDYDDDDMNELHRMYASMKKGELRAHHDAIKKCAANMGMAKSEMEDDANDAEGYRPNGGPKDGEAASKKTAPASDEQALEKSANIPNPPKASDKQALEKSKNIPNPPKASDKQALEKSERDTAVDEVSLLKSELEIVKANSAKEKQELEAALQKFLTKFVEKTAPAGKAITSLDIIAKTENTEKEKPLSKSEIDAKLLAKAKDVSLSKSDRDAINSYYFSKNIEKVSHLLK